MESGNGTANISKGRLWTGRVLTTLVALFLLFDSVTKLMKVKQVMDAFQQMQYPTTAAVTIGSILLVCLIFYVIPQTAVFGAMLLTGYLGGAVEAQFRVSRPLFEMTFPILFAVVMWAGLFCREPRLAKLMPWRK